MAYRLEDTSAAQRDLQALPRDILMRVEARLQALAEDPARLACDGCGAVSYGYGGCVWGTIGSSLPSMTCSKWSPLRMCGIGAMCTEVCEGGSTAEFERSERIERFSTWFTGELMAMAELLKLRQAARLIGVSPGRLCRASADGRPTAAPGGGPGKPTLVSLEAVQGFCQREGLRIPEAPEMMAHSERLGRTEPSDHSERSTALPAIASPTKAGLMTWSRTLRGSGMSLQNIAAELNARGIPTPSGKGRS